MIALQERSFRSRHLRSSSVAIRQLDSKRQARVMRWLALATRHLAAATPRQAVVMLAVVMPPRAVARPGLAVVRPSMIAGLVQRWVAIC